MNNTFTKIIIFGFLLIACVVIATGAEYKQHELQQFHNDKVGVVKK